MSGAWVAALVGGAYLLGSVPFGLLIGLARGTDIRKAGSGNIGATNVGRVLGRPWGVLAFVLDMAKGLVPMLAAGALLGGFSDAHLGVAEYAAWVGVGAAAIIGHVLPVFLKFRGGKGVATACGVFSILAPTAALPALALFIGTVWLTKYVSLGSMLASLSLPTIAYATGSPTSIVVTAAAACALIVFRHRSNLVRLRIGTERRFGRRAQEVPAARTR